MSAGGAEANGVVHRVCSSTGSHFSMLGIGDIVMPGLLLCFVLRYDNYKKQANAESATPGRMQRVSYFHCTLVGYFVGKGEDMAGQRTASDENDSDCG